MSLQSAMDANGKALDELCGYVSGELGKAAKLAGARRLKITLVEEPERGRDCMLALATAGVGAESHYCTVYWTLDGRPAGAVSRLTGKPMPDGAEYHGTDGGTDDARSIR